MTRHHQRLTYAAARLLAARTALVWLPVEEPDRSIVLREVRRDLVYVVRQLAPLASPHARRLSRVAQRLWPRAGQGDAQ